MTEVFVVSGGAVPVSSKHPLGSGRVLARQAGVAALQDAGLTYADMDALYCGVAMPTSPAAVLVGKEFGLTGIPVVQVTNASASGLAAIHAAADAMRAGGADRVLVIGYDVPTTLDDPIAAQGYLPPPALFGMWARRRMHDCGTTPETLARIAAKNINNARAIPFASRRPDHAVTVADVLASRPVADPLTALMCTQWVYGAAAVVLCTRKGLDSLPRPPATVARLEAAEFRSEEPGPHHIIEGAIVGPPAITRAAADAALARAGRRREDLDAVQIHDAFAIEELVYYELLGFAPEGGADALAAQGAFGPGSRDRFGLPEFSTDGGLIGRGHPGGPSGVFQAIETLRRFRTTADRLALCHMLGAGSTCLAQVWGRVDL
ncbi:thiolase family protein [Ruixingdingia sedimenti]|uniref:Thiolase family protein n=1 Tax=Ruixingdingia sedimenti TaxID=3073604 RepID=A0ABU1F8I3_9RHOB|nr:thiolase family protein [Xinfangfangia sp. LG-4]MDR5653180.1 thiolase family protein [Xinfangfangia sp. LG-4]